jgi:hypothetical protein
MARFFACDAVSPSHETGLRATVKAFAETLIRMLRDVRRF